MTSVGPWVCGDCRSVNRESASRCYSCRTPRALALNPDAREENRPRPISDAPPAERAKTARTLGAIYRSTAPLATIAQIMVLIVTAITLAGSVLTIVFFKDLEGSLGDLSTFDPDVALDQAVFLDLLHNVVLGGWITGLVAWGAWLARVVANVPALGGGWPGETPRFAFISTLIPGGNLYWTTGTLRQVLTALSPAGSPRLGLLTAWWLTVTPTVILLFNIGPLRWLRSIVETIVSALLLILSGGDVTSLLDATVLVEIVGAGLLLAAAAFAVLLVQLVERLQADRFAALEGAVPRKG
jgi:hypothetical protein